MSGPNYPHPNPKPGSNAIGSFVIGVSPIGTIPSFDIWTTIISQYANSPTITDMIEAFNAAMDLTEDMDAFYDTIWNITSAVGYGLDVWGRIVGVSRILQLPSDAVYFGFQESGSWVGFNQGPFFSGQAVGTSFALSDDAYRRLILAKAAANIWNGSMPQQNQILLDLFPGRGNCYVIDNQDMTMTYRFKFVLSPAELSIVSSGVLPRPSGVSVIIQQG